MAPKDRDDVPLLKEPAPPIDVYLASEPRATYIRRRNSLRVVLLTNFLSAVGFSILMSTVWPYLERMGGQKSFLGYIVGAFSIGQLLGSPFFGYWVNHISPKTILISAIIMRILGNVGYAFAGSVTGHKEWFLFEVRTLVGFGAGSMAVCMSYTSEATTPSERTGYMSNIAASGGLGFIIGPLLGMSLGSLKPGIVEGEFVLDFLTGPAYIAATLAVFNLILVIIFFNDVRISSVLKQQKAAKDAEDGGAASAAAINADTPKPPKPYRDNVAVMATMFCYFIACVTLSVFETVSSPLTMDEFGWNAQQGVIYNGIIGGVGGVISVGGFLLAKPIAQRFGLRNLLIGSAVLMVLGNLFFIPFAGSPPKQWVETDDDDPSTASGCRAEWCENLPALPFAQLCIGTLILCISNPMCTVMCFTLFSLILGPFPQGLWMGILNASGSLARAFGPLVISNLYATYGPRTVYAFVAGLNVLVIVVGLAFYRRMVPHELLGPAAALAAVGGKKKKTKTSL